VPTPNIPAPSAPTTLQSSTRPLGLADVPQPGASAGGASPSAAPTDIDYSAIPRLLAGDLALVPPSRVGAPGFGETGLGAPGLGDGAAAVPGGSAPAQIDNLYFLHDRAPLGAPGAPPASPAISSPEVVDAVHPGQGAPEDFVIAGPSEADPHRFSDAAALVTPPAPAPMPSGYESNASPGAAGPAASDALYFVGHSGGHPGLMPATPAQAKEEPQGYEPQLFASSEVAREPFDPYRVKRDFPILRQQVHGKPLIWLDNAASTQKPQAVIDRLSHFYEYENSNIHRAAHALAARARPTPMKPRAKKFAAF